MMTLGDALQVNGDLSRAMRQCSNFMRTLGLLELDPSKLSEIFDTLKNLHDASRASAMNCILGEFGLSLEKRDALLMLNQIKKIR